jgi:hypothetical protein
MAISRPWLSQQACKYKLLTSFIFLLGWSLPNDPC